jgi:hypothetical protein
LDWHLKRAELGGNSRKQDLPYFFYRSSFLLLVKVRLKESTGFEKPGRWMKSKANILYDLM